MREIKKIIVHCSDTKPHQDIGAADIRRWHMDPPPKGNDWDDIGYHGVIRRDGTLESGRPMDQVGAHCKGHNADSIGICLVGGMSSAGKPENNFTAAQFTTLTRLLSDLTRKFPGAAVYGHRDFDSGKACPCFNVRGWWAEQQKKGPADA